MGSFDLVYAKSAKADLECIMEHLFRNYVFFGDNPAEAVEKVEARIFELRQFINGLKAFPQKGRRRDDLKKGLRLLPDQRKAAIAYEVVEKTKTVKVLRIFYGGEDYESVMHDRPVES
ncbi:type II toxin-antitoxin system RelE/ParE family toxin [Magnetospira sp. QH-2]|uniref:type II toxin-antitoxin system RelE/ParE family toxin n=1 Tax=Magnetospira sp. (strain QH-2) TaxID=1288970 RepID=UPI0003E8151D|nr:type II toxin-antitoxin system RelE/ParE family toxin [Magnetospira sp. QH-2]CCQ72460.1 conserved protein of unknown function [Magnetospira sp. QH-2]